MIRGRSTSASRRGTASRPKASYVASWVTTDLRRCYQVMECADRRLLEEWMDNWRDIVDFEVLPVMTSADAARAVAALALRTE